MPILNRKRDLVYFIFFLIHIPVIFCKSSHLSIFNSHMVLDG